MSGRSSGPSGGSGHSGKPPRPWIPSGSGGVSHNAFAKASIEARQQQLAPARPALPPPMAVQPAAQDAALAPMPAHPAVPPLPQAASPQLSAMPAPAASAAPAALTPMQTSARARANWQRGLSAARALTTGGAQRGTGGPPKVAPPNAVYQRTDHDGTLTQNTIYNQHGQPIAQVDFKQHGRQAPPGHSHRTATPSDIASAHSGSGGSDIHYTPQSTPGPWLRVRFPPKKEG